MLSKCMTGVIATFAFGALASGNVLAQDTVKIGLIMPMTGQQASTGKQIKAAVKLYMKQNGDTVAGKKIEVIFKDDAGGARQHQALAQELIVNDKVNSLPASASRRPRLPPPRSPPKPKCRESSWRPAPRSSPSARPISCGPASRWRSRP